MSGYLTITDAARSLRAKEVSAVELTRHAIEVADTYDALLGTFIARYSECALEAAASADAAMARGEDLGLLHGVPLGIKDLIITADGPISGQSLVLDDGWRSSIRDAPVVSRLRASGGIIVGKTTTMELAVGYPDAEKPFPIPRNPWDLTTWTGGSSSGTASGIATGMFLGGLGTDTAGSIRVPAAYCGVSGLKPTFGLVPKSGCVALGYSLDHIGPMARSSRDCALMLTVLAGHDASDPCAISAPATDYAATLTGDLNGLRAGVDRLARYSSTTEDPALAGAFETALDVLRDRGAELVDVELPFYRETVAANMVTVLAEGLTHHSPRLIKQWGDFFASTRRSLTLAAYATAADYVRAQMVRRAAQHALGALFRTVDLVVTPTSASGAPQLTDGPPDFSDLPGIGVHTGYWNGVGNPALSIPMGFSSTNLPLGLHVAGRPFEDATVLRAGDAFQQSTDWHLLQPRLTAPTHPDGHGVRAPAREAEVSKEPSDTLLELAALNPTESDRAYLLDAFPRLREMIALLYSVPLNHDAEPCLIFRANPER